MAFDRNGNRLNIDEHNNTGIKYKEISDLNRGEELINYRSGTREGFKIQWKHKFGLVSFKDFPQIYIDLGEE